MYQKVLCCRCTQYFEFRIADVNLFILFLYQSIGSSLQVDQKLLGDHHLGCNLLYTKEEREHVDLLQIDHNVPSSHEALNSSTQKILNSNNKAPNHKSFSMKK